MTNTETKNNLFEELFTGQQPGELVDAPVYDQNGNSKFKVYLQLLSYETVQQVKKESHIHAMQELKDQMKSGVVTDQSALYEETYADHNRVISLFHAIRHPDDIKLTLFPYPGEIKKRLESNQILHFTRMYKILEDKHSGFYGNVNSNETFEDILKHLQKDVDGSPIFLLDRLPPVTQQRFMLFMVNRLLNLQPDKSSAGSPST